VVVEKNLAIPMRDGTVLRADLHRPEGTGPAPVLLQRTPYNKGQTAIRAHALDPRRAALAGYAVLVQDVRGRYASEGDFYPFRNEAADGYDTVAWIAAQPWCDGNVGMFGVSYEGAAQWLAAIAAPPHLRAIAPQLTADPYASLYQGGAFQLGFAQTWTAAQLAMGNLMRRPDLDPAEVVALRTRLVAFMDQPAELQRFLPPAELPLFRAHDLAPFYYDWLAHPTEDAYWQGLGIAYRLDRVSVPALNVGGFYDPFHAGTIANFLGLHAAGGTEAQRGQRLILGPWAHGTPLDRRAGACDFGAGASGAAIDLAGHQLAFFDRHLRGVGEGLVEDPPVLAFFMGANRWRELDAWPPPGVHTVCYYLRSDGWANSAFGSGLLDPEPPDPFGVPGEPPDSFTYDPRAPVPTRGGAVCCLERVLPGGVFDQRPLDARADILVYQTPPLTHDLTLAGPLTVELYTATDARDTDFTAKLIDVHPDGYAQNLADGIVRARYRESGEDPSLLEPGEVYRFEIELGHTAIVLSAGHRLRLDISSSNFPRFDRNPNHGGDIATATAADLRPARQTVFHDAARPSHIRLPVLG
jgi:putative CocE/NonD family hydrolase